ncbi:transposase [Sphingomonas sp. IW22]|uniref:transposase n=1 Tax=Sphingomonas sp. IW22 TaxID=3242489 RepID=UPI00351FF016
MRGFDLTPFDKGQIYALRKHAEWPYEQIASTLNLTLSAVSKYCQRNINNHLPHEGNRINCKRPRKTTDRFDRHIVRYVEQHPFKGIRQVASDLSAIQNLSYGTINRRLKETGLLSFSPAHKPFLSKAHKAARLVWAQQHRQTTWSAVIFSDESKFQMNNRQQFVRRRKNTRLQDRFVNHLPNRSSCHCMVWGSFCRNGYSDLVRIQHRLNSEGYVELLEQNLLPLVDQMNNIEFYQQDNAPIHTAKFTRDWFDDHDLPLLPWPAISPDANPIENVWGRMKHQLHYMLIKPTTSDALFSTCQDLWSTIMGEENYRYSLVDSMERRLSAIIDAAGGYTKY